MDRGYMSVLKGKKESKVTRSFSHNPLRLTEGKKFQEGKSIVAELD